MLFFAKDIVGHTRNLAVITKNLKDGIVIGTCTSILLIKFRITTAFKPTIGPKQHVLVQKML